MEGKMEMENSKEKETKMEIKKVMPNKKEIAEGLKNKGNEEFKNKNYVAAKKLYSQAIGIDH
jgi:hypothetical protein